MSDTLVFSAHEEREWEDSLGKFSSKDIYFTSKYHRLCEFDTGGKAYGYYACSGNDHLFYPFLLSPISGTDGLNGNAALFDLETCYGYSGPLCTSSDRDVLESLWAPFFDWCAHTGVIAGLTRCHPILATQLFLPSASQRFLNRDTVFIDLAKTEEELWSGYPPNQRTQIRQASRFGVTCRLGNRDELLSVFVPLYRATMKHLNASARYFFKEGYFKYLSEEFTTDSDILIIEASGQVIASAIFLRGEEFYHYHLSASLPEFRNLRPNNLMLHEATKLGQSYGLKKMHLGGGRSAATDDALLKFKASFSTERVPFYISEAVFLPTLYNSLCERWLQVSRVTVRPPEVLFYRKPIPPEDQSL